MGGEAGGKGSAALRVEDLVVGRDLLGLAVAFDQQLVRREDLGVDLGPLLGVFAVPGLLQFRGDGGHVHGDDAGLDHAGQGHFLSHLGIGARGVDHGEDLVALIGGAGADRLTLKSLHLG